MQYFFYSISIMMISWIIGMGIDNMLKKKAFYNNLSEMHWIKSKKVSRILGLGVFKYFLVNSFWKYFNKTIKTNSKADKEELIRLRSEMTSAEIGHLIGFVSILIIVSFLAIFKIMQGAIVPLLILNIPMNLYPSLLQQLNKARIDRLIKTKQEYEERRI